MSNPITIPMLDRMIQTAKEGKEKTIQNCERDGTDRVWFTQYERTREFDQMIELETQFKAALEHLAELQPQA